MYAASKGRPFAEKKEKKQKQKQKCEVEAARKRTLAWISRHRPILVCFTNVKGSLNTTTLLIPAVPGVKKSRVDATHHYPPQHPLGAAIYRGAALSYSKNPRDNFPRYFAASCLLRSKSEKRTIKGNKPKTTHERACQTSPFWDSRYHDGFSRSS
jgi:hypothetical protein